MAYFKTTIMKPLLSIHSYSLIFSLLVLSTYSFGQAVSVNTDGAVPDASAILDISSTDKGLLVPRMTANQRAGINDPATGLIVYQTDEAMGFYYNGGTPSSPSWVLLIAGPIHGKDIAPGIQTTTNTTIALGNTNNTAAELRLLEPNGSGNNYTAFKAQPQATDITYTLPDEAPGLNEVLKIESFINNNATLDWSVPTAGAPVYTRTDIAVAAGDVTIDATGKSFIRMTSGAGTFNLVGITGGVDGQFLVLVNLTNRAMTIINEDPGVVASTRIHTEFNSNYVKLGGEVCSLFIYDGGQGRWRML